MLLSFHTHTPFCHAYVKYVTLSVGGVDVFVKCPLFLNRFNQNYNAQQI